MRNIIVLVIIVTACAYGGSKWYLHNEVSEGVDTAVIALSPYAKIEYDDIASTLTGELTIEGIRIRIEGFRDELYIDRLGIDTPSFLSLLKLNDIASMQGDELPEDFGFFMDEMRVPATSDYYRKFYAFALEAQGAADANDAAAECTGRYGLSPDALAGLGYDEQTVSSSINFNNQADTLSVMMSVSVEEMWDMSFTIMLSGAALSDVSRAMASRPRLSSMGVEIIDRSMNERVEEYCSRRGLSEQEILQAQLDTFKSAGQDFGIEFDSYLIDPFKEFIGGKSTLTITAKPNTPIELSQIELYKPSDVPALLNLEAVAR